jgi:hypothetical protein
MRALVGSSGFVGPSSLAVTTWRVAVFAGSMACMLSLLIACCVGTVPWVRHLYSSCSCCPLAGACSLEGEGGAAAAASLIAVIGNRAAAVCCCLWATLLATAAVAHHSFLVMWFMWVCTCACLYCNNNRASAVTESRHAKLPTTAVTLLLT